MRRFFTSNKGKEPASAPPSQSADSQGATNGGPSSSSPPPAFDSNNSASNNPLTIRWYVLFDGQIPDFLITVCEALGLGWSILKNSTEGSSGPADAARNKFRERFVIVFPQDLGSLPSLMDDDAPPEYTDEAEEMERKAKQKRNLFDSVVDDITYLHSRNGLVELFNVLFMCRSLKQVVQTRTARQDKSMEDFIKIKGAEVSLRTIQFDGVEDIDERIKYLTDQGVIWAKYGLWTSDKLSPEDNFRRGQWMIFGTWPETYHASKKEKLSHNWQEPYHLGKGSGRYSTGGAGAVLGGNFG